MINLFFEALQHEALERFFVPFGQSLLLSPSFLSPVLRGTFDWHDIWNCVVGGAIAMFMLWLLQSDFTEKIHVLHFKKAAQSLCMGTVLVFGLISIIATSPLPCEVESGEDCTPRRSQFVDPVYLSYEDLRSAIVATGPEEIIKAGKIFLTDRYLFVNDLNRGIHVFNNTDPKFPEHIGFIKIPGNVDIAVKNSTLFADSFIDLVTIDIRRLSESPPEVTVLKRIEKIFPYNPYQMIDDDNIILSEVDQEKGVIIGYEVQQ